jgi:hypothetical protein
MTLHLSDNKIFVPTMKALIRDHKILDVVESGTYDGTGSTTVFAKTGCNVYSIEADKERVRNSRDNLRMWDRVHVFHGLSMPYNDAVKFIVEDDIYDINPIPDLEFDGDIYRDRLGTLKDFATSFEEGGKENILANLICNNRPQLIFLDSGGGIGLCEFEHTMKLIYPLWYKHKILVMDDIRTYKHYRSVKRLEAQGFKFIDCGCFGYTLFENA